MGVGGLDEDAGAVGRALASRWCSVAEMRCANRGHFLEPALQRFVVCEIAYLLDDWVSLSSALMAIAPMHLNILQKRVQESPGVTWPLLW